MSSLGMNLNTTNGSCSSLSTQPVQYFPFLKKKGGERSLQLYFDLFIEHLIGH